MIDLKALRADPEAFRRALRRKRFKDQDLERVLQLDEETRRQKAALEELRATRNAASKRIPRAEPEEKAKLMSDMKRVAAELKGKEPELRELEMALQESLYMIPNPPDPSAPDGAGDRKSVV